MKERTKENIFWFMGGMMTLALIISSTILLKIGLSNLIQIIELRLGL